MPSDVPSFGFDENVGITSHGDPFRAVSSAFSDAATDVASDAAAACACPGGEALPRTQR
jgi:hypothetical protein